MKETVSVANKSSGRVVYNLPEMNIRREFMPHEIRNNIPVSELEALSQQPGGKELLSDYLQVQDKEVITYLLNTSPEQEYWLNDKDIPAWLSNCSLAELQDALDFAPDGTKDLIKQYAVELELNDYSKREAIKTQLGFDVTKAIEMTDNKKTTATEKATRRVTPVEETPVRRAATSVVVTPKGDNKEE